MIQNFGIGEFSSLALTATLNSYWGLVQGSGVGGLLLNLFRCPAIQVAGPIELPCATPSKGACEVGGEIGVSGVAVGVVELFLSAIDVGGMEFGLREPRMTRQWRSSMPSFVSLWLLSSDRYFGEDLEWNSMSR